MKVCAKCQTEYSDDMAFCSYCGTPLQPKIQENVCPACGKEVHAQNLRFCPYCGYSFLSSETNKHDISNKPNALEANNKPITTPLQAAKQENACPGCGKELHAKNLHSCPYCNYKFVSPNTVKPDNNISNTTGSKNVNPDIPEKTTVIEPNRVNNTHISIPVSQKEPSTNGNNSSLFSSSGRRGRLNYFFMNMFLGIVFVALQMIINSIFRFSDIAYIVVMLVTSILGTYLLYCNEAKRFHDLDKPSSWAAIFVIVSIVVYFFNPLFGLIVTTILNIYPQFFKGTSGPNQYGDEP